MRRVLIAEDDALVRDMLAWVFEEIGWGVNEAHSGVHAMQIMSEGIEVDLLFTDIRMPGLDGWGLAEAVRLHHPELPVIYCSGYSSEAPRGVQDSIFLHKPCGTDDILNALRELKLHDGHCSL